MMVGVSALYDTAAFGGLTEEDLPSPPTSFLHFLFPQEFGPLL